MTETGITPRAAAGPGHAFRGLIGSEFKDVNCPRGQAGNDERTRFCQDCGARLEQTCPSCGEPVGAGKKFCRSCGAALAPAAPPAAERAMDSAARTWARLASSWATAESNAVCAESITAERRPGAPRG